MHTTSLHTLAGAALLLAGAALAQTPLPTEADPALAAPVALADRVGAWEAAGLRDALPWLEVQGRARPCTLLRVAGAGPGCRQTAGDVALRRSGIKFSAGLRELPPLPGGVRADLQVRGWSRHAATASSRVKVKSQGSARGLDAALELSRSQGPLTAYAGRTQPLWASSGAGRWQTDFAGVAWRLQPGQVLELGTERHQALQRDGQERVLTVRYAHTQGARGLWGLSLARQAEANGSSWRLSASLQWRL
jgi:hypothetical protein